MAHHSDSIATVVGVNARHQTVQPNVRRDEKVNEPRHMEIMSAAYVTTSKPFSHDAGVLSMMRHNQEEVIQFLNQRHRTSVTAVAGGAEIKAQLAGGCRRLRAWLVVVIGKVGWAAVVVAMAAQTVLWQVG